MAIKLRLLLPLIGGGLILTGCANSDDTSPSMGKVAPKPNMNMSSQLPPEVQRQIAQSKPGSDASKMGAMKPHNGKP